MSKSRIVKELARRANELGDDVARKFIRAWHGSPHDFRRFDDTRLGTGEGNAAFGAGHYAAGKRGTGEFYRDSLSPPNKSPSMEYRIPGDKFPLEGIDNTAAKYIDKHGYEKAKRIAQAWIDESTSTANAVVDADDFESFLTAAAPEPVPDPKAVDLMAAIERLKNETFEKSSRGAGRLYELDINLDEGELFDWDKPVNAQPDNVKEALQGMGVDTDMYGADKELVREEFETLINNDRELYDQSDMLEKVLDKWEANPADNTTRKRLNHYFREYHGDEDFTGYLDEIEDRYSANTGGDIYRQLQEELGSDVEVSNKLREAGVGGIRYLDEGSRNPAYGSGEVDQTRNYVVFDGDTIDVIKKYGIAGAAVGAAGLQSEEADASTSAIRQGIRKLGYKMFRQAGNAVDIHDEAGGFVKRYDSAQEALDDLNGAKSQAPVDDYRGEHRAPYRDEEGYHPSMDDVTPMYGDDIYSPNAKRYHGGTATSDEAIDIIQQARNNPDKQVTVYRAVPYEEKPSELHDKFDKAISTYQKRGNIPKDMNPEDVPKEDWYDWAWDQREKYKSMPDDATTDITDINPRDWVSLTKGYAKDHGESALNGKYKIIKTKTKASNLFNEGYVDEWGFDPKSLAALAGVGGLAASQSEQAEAGVGGKTVKELSDHLEKIPGVKTLNLYETGRGDIKLDTIIIDKDKRKSGIGSSVVDQINAYADDKGQRVILSPAVQDDYQGTTSRNRLVKFYKRHGFKENKGRAKDFEISEGMFRNPVTPAIAGTTGILGAGSITSPKAMANYDKAVAELKRRGLTHLIPTDDTIEAPVNPRVQKTADFLRGIETPIGNPYESTVNVLDKWAYGENADKLDMLMGVGEVADPSGAALLIPELMESYMK